MARSARLSGRSNQARIEMTLGPPHRAGLIRGLKGIVHMGHSLLRLPFSTLAGTRGIVREFQRFALGFGMVGGVFGLQNEPYRNVVEHGSAFHHARPMISDAISQTLDPQ